MLEIRDLTAGYGEGTVIEGLSLSLGRAEVMALLGRNGVGKTTLLRAIMGLVRPRGGDIRLDGHRIDGRQPFEVARLGAAIVPQGREIFADLSVTENLQLGCRGGGRLEEAFDLFPALSQFRNAAAGRLSGGQQQQLAIARALLMQPRLLLLDEPSEGIQPSIVQEIGKVIATAAARKAIAVILVEQNIDLALSLAARVDFMSNGRIAASLAAPALAADRGLVERYMGL